MRRLILVALLSLPAAVAFADAIDLPPEDCPRGASGVSSHAGAWCEATSCATATDCSAYEYTPQGRMSYTCEPAVGLCVSRESYVAGGMRPADVVPPTLSRDVASAPCTSDADCTGPARCIVAPRCIPVAHPVSGMIARACACRASAPRSGSRGALALVLVLVGAGIVARRRRARVSSPSRALPAARGGASSPSP